MGHHQLGALQDGGSKFASLKAPQDESKLLEACHLSIRAMSSDLGKVTRIVLSCDRCACTHLCKIVRA